MRVWVTVCDNAVPNTSVYFLFMFLLQFQSTVIHWKLFKRTLEISQEQSRPFQMDGRLNQAIVNISFKTEQVTILIITAV